MKFRAFRRKKDNLYYFQFLSEENQVQLNSPSYADKDLCFNGIREVINNSGKAKNYNKKTDQSGNHYFILTTSIGQEIGRSIKFKTAKKTDLAIAKFMAEAPKAATREVESTTEKKPAKDTKTSKDKKGRVYLSQNQPYLCGNLTYDTFQNESNQKYYFTFNDQEGNALLINGDIRGFETIEELDSGIKAVLEFATIKKSYEKKVAKNEKHYFLIKNDEGKSVARSGRFYKQKKEMNAAVRLVQCHGIEGDVPKQQLVSDNYLPIAAYAGAAGFYTFQDEKSGDYYFAFNNDDGKTFLRSQGYKTASARDNGIQSVINNGPKEKSWNTFSENRRHYYALKAANHQEIARSDYYKEEAKMLEDFNLVKGENSPIGVGSAVVGGALMSALMINQQKEEKTKAAQKAKEEEKAAQKAEDAKLAALAAANLQAEQAAKQKAEAQKLKAEQEAVLAAEAEAAAKLAAEEERKKAAAAAATAAAMSLAATENTQTTPPYVGATTKSTSGSGFPAWLIPLIIALLLIILALIYFKGCDGCNKPVPPIEDPITTVDTIEQDTTPFGKGGQELGFIPGSMEFLMANHLKAFDSSFPETFTADNIAFAKNKIRLDTKARKQLDNLAVLLKEYPKAKIEIYGYVTANEKTFYKGNKEVSLDDARAREVFNYMKSNGIQENRMEFYGNGLDDKAGIKIKLISRGVTR